MYSIAGNSFHVEEDYASILLKYDDKKSGSVETNWLTPYKMRTLTATGTGGVASADYLEQSLDVWNSEGRRRVDIEKGEPLKKEIRHFLQSIHNGTTPEPSGEDGKYTLDAAISAIESYKNGLSISLNM